MKLTVLQNCPVLASAESWYYASVENVSVQCKRTGKKDNVNILEVSTCCVNILGVCRTSCAVMFCIANVVASITDMTASAEVLLLRKGQELHKLKAPSHWNFSLSTTMHKGPTFL